MAERPVADSDDVSGYASYDETIEGAVASRGTVRVRAEYRVPSQVERKRVVVANVAAIHCAKLTRVDVVQVLRKIVAVDAAIAGMMTVSTGTSTDDFITPRGCVDTVLGTQTLFVLSVAHGPLFTIHLVFHMYNGPSTSISRANTISLRRNDDADANFYKDARGNLRWKGTPYEGNNIPHTLASHVARFKYVIGKIKEGKRLGIDKVSSVTRTGVSWGCWHAENRYLGNLERLCKLDPIFSELLNNPYTTWGAWMKAVDAHTEQNSNSNSNRTRNET